MDPRKLKLMLLPYQGFRNEADDGNDLGGDVIDMAAESDDSGEQEDRGDNFSPTEEAKPEAAKPEVKAEEPAEDEEKPEAKAPANIPKARFDEVLSQRNAERERREALEREIQELRNGTAKPAEAKAGEPAQPDAGSDIKTLEKQYIELLMDGKDDEALDLRIKINQQLIAQAEQQAEQRVTARQSQQQMAAELSKASAEVVEAWPYLDSDEGAEALELIIAKRNALIAAGDKPADALRKAANLIAPRFAPESDEHQAKAEPKKDERLKAAIQRNLKDSELQPPNLTGVGNRAMDTVKKDVTKMTEEEFEALPESVKRQMRGD